ncbi:hypothetical protein BVRB_8g195200 [Beta vulgaris subsp. vulgaris]|nr:hypothetical protein BVRB_8g195200 [Beta vulgaris subsp. vulgaris]
MCFSYLNYSFCSRVTVSFSNDAINLEDDALLLFIMVV